MDASDQAVHGSSPWSIAEADARGAATHGSRRGCDKGATGGPDIHHARHVRDRSNPRPGRHVGPRTRRSGWSRRCATAGPDGDARQAHRAARAGPHPAGDHRRRRRRPAARLRGRPGHGGRERRDLQPPRAARGARGARPPLRHELGQRGGRARLRGARPRLRAPAERHLRLRPLGRPRTAPRRRARRRSASSRSTGGATGGAWRWRPRSARCWRPAWCSRRWTGWRSTTTSPAASCPRRGRCSRACSKLPAGVALLVVEQDGAAAGDELARAARRPPAGPTTTSWPASSPSASPTPSSAR